MEAPLLIALCPTYKRPKLLENAIACFLRQSYEHKKMLVFDDASQVGTCQFEDVQVISTPERRPNLPRKYNDMVRQALSLFPHHGRPVVFVVWEDDDIFLPHHMTQISMAYQQSMVHRTFLISKHVYSTYNMPRGQVRIEGAEGRFHSSWAFSKELLDAVGGWPESSELIFDQKFGKELAKRAQMVMFYDRSPSYVYRWGNDHWHGSQSGDTGFQKLWDKLESLPADPHTLDPKLDDETESIFANVAIGAVTPLEQEQPEKTE